MLLFYTLSTFLELGLYLLLREYCIVKIDLNKVNLPFHKEMSSSLLSVRPLITFDNPPTDQPVTVIIC